MISPKCKNGGKQHLYCLLTKKEITPIYPVPNRNRSFGQVVEHSTRPSSDLVNACLEPLQCHINNIILLTRPPISRLRQDQDFGILEQLGPSQDRVLKKVNY